MVFLSCEIHRIENIKCELKSFQISFRLFVSYFFFLFFSLFNIYFGFTYSCCFLYICIHLVGRFFLFHFFFSIWSSTYHIQFRVCFAFDDTILLVSRSNRFRPLSCLFVCIFFTFNSPISFFFFKHCRIAFLSSFAIYFVLLFLRFYKYEICIQFELIKILKKRCNHDEFHDIYRFNVMQNSKR